MLVASDVTFRAGHAILLAGVSAAFTPGTLTVVVGPNGAGKSTFVRLLCGQVPPTSGEVRLHDRRLQDWEDAALARMRAVLSQEVELAFPLRVWEVVMMGRYPHFTGRPSHRDEAVCEDAMRFFDVWEYADREYLTLSGGERQRVQFARVCAQVWEATNGAARCLVLDEPLTFLDVRYQFAFMNRIRELIPREQLIAVGVVHDLNLAARFADTLLVLHQGRLVAAGPPAEVLTAALVERVFGIRPVIHSAGGRVHVLFD